MNSYGSTTIGTREPGSATMKDEIRLEDLEEAQQKLEQNLLEEILKREVSNSKFQAHFDVVNERLDELINIAESIRLHLLNMNNINKNLGNKDVQVELKEEIEELGDGLVDSNENVDENIKDYDGKIESDFIEVEKIVVEDKSVKGINVTDNRHESIVIELKKVVPSLNLKGEIILNLSVNELLLELPGWRAPKRKDGIGVSLLGNELKYEINSGCDLNSRDGYGETALMICARHKHEECLKFLAAAGPDFGSCDVSNYSTMSIAGLSMCRTTDLGFQNAVLEVIRARNTARSSNPKVFSSLLFVIGANIDDLHIKHQDLHNIVVRDQALTKLIKHQDLHSIDEVDDFGFSAVMVAAAGGHVEMLRLLVNAGADLEMQNKYGETTIILAKGTDLVAAAWRVVKENFPLEAMNGRCDVLFLTTESSFQVQATALYTLLVGDYFHNKAGNQFVLEFLNKHKNDVICNIRAPSIWWVNCERAKITLSSTHQSTIDIDSPYEGEYFFPTLASASLEGLNRDLFRNCLESVEQCSGNTKRDSNAAYDNVLISGSTKITMLQRLMQEFFSREKLGKNVNFDEIVLYDVAVQATSLTVGGVMTMLTKRNTLIPSKKEQIFFTYLNNKRMNDTSLVRACLMPSSWHNPEELSLLKGGIVYSNAVVTVSPTYLKETLCSGRFVATLIRHRDKYFGILNGIDTAIWNPATDAFLPAKFDANQIEGKKICKLSVQRGLVLAQEAQDSAEVPLVVSITKLVAHKGFHLITNAIRHVEIHGGQRVIRWTAPDARVGSKFEGLAELHNQGSSIRILLMYSEELSHMLYAAADIVLVPFIYEPCGLSQMIGMYYGTRGLADTVFDMDDQSQRDIANGYVFKGMDEGFLNCALDRAFSYYQEKPDEWKGMVKKKNVADGLKYIRNKFSSSDPRGRGSYQPGGIVMDRELGLMRMKAEGVDSVGKEESGSGLIKNLDFGFEG